MCQENWLGFLDIAQTLLLGLCLKKKKAIIINILFPPRSCEILYFCQLKKQKGQHDMEVSSRSLILRVPYLYTLTDLFYFKELMIGCQ